MCEVLAVLKNGMYDDPATSNAGIVARKLRNECTASKLSELAATYLTWRFCYLLCGVFFLAVHVGVSWQSYEESKRAYQAFVAQLKFIPNEHFNTLVAALAVYELCLWVLSVVSWLITVFALICAAPRLAVRRLRASQRLLWSAWLIAFVPAFLVCLVVPMRAFVPWDAVVNDVCVASIRQTFNMPGSNLRKHLSAMQTNGIITEDDAVYGLLGEVEPWCVKQGEDWYSQFYNATVQCIWHTDQSCRDVTCASVLQNSPDMLECLSDCFAFAISKQRAAGNPTSTVRKRFTDSFRQCSNKGGPPPRASALPKLPQDIRTVSVGDLYAFTVSLQQVAVMEASQSATLLSLQAEYVVGTLIGTVLGKALLSAALSLLGGLGEALMNIKAMFPGSQAPAWILILTTSEAVPVYAALLGVFNQTFGDGILAITCVLAAMLVALGNFTGWRMLRFRSGNVEREKFYRLVWVEYGLRILVGAGIIASATVWVLNNDQWGIRDYIREEILTPQVLAGLVLQFYARKISTAIASTDAVLSAFTQAEHHQIEDLSGEKKEAHVNALTELIRLGAGSAAKGDNVEAL